MWQTFVSSIVLLVTDSSPVEIRTFRLAASSESEDPNEPARCCRYLVELHYVRSRREIGPNGPHKAKSSAFPLVQFWGPVNPAFLLILALGRGGPKAQEL